MTQAESWLLHHPWVEDEYLVGWGQLTAKVCAQIDRACGLPSDAGVDKLALSINTEHPKAVCRVCQIENLLRQTAVYASIVLPHAVKTSVGQEFPCTRRALLVPLV
jgi:hypothetical protein